MEISMNIKEFNQKLSTAKKPVIVEFWAPWCGPCRVMAPALETVAKAFSERVELVRINADESPEILQSLKVFGIPTMIAFSNGEQIFRKTGAQTEENLRMLFEAAEKGEKSITLGISPLNRMIRMGTGSLLVIMGLANQIQWLLIVVGGLIIFSSFYDRCPIFTAISKWVKSRMSTKTS